MTIIFSRENARGVPEGTLIVIRPDPRVHVIPMFVGRLTGQRSCQSLTRHVPWYPGQNDSTFEVLL